MHESRLALIGGIAAYWALSATGLVLLRHAATVASARFAAGFALYGLSFGVWVLIQRALPLSVAFPVVTGGLIVILQAVGYATGERLGAAHLAGVAMILGGTALVFARGGASGLAT